jgi:hypothetical protein
LRQAKQRAGVPLALGADERAGRASETTRPSDYPTTQLAPLDPSKVPPPASALKLPEPSPAPKPEAPPRKPPAEGESTASALLAKKRSRK